MSRQWLERANMAPGWGAIAGAVLVLGKRSLTDLPTVLIALFTIALLLRFKKIPEPIIILVAAIVGILLKTFL